MISCPPLENWIRENKQLPDGFVEEFHYRNKLSYAYPNIYSGKGIVTMGANSPYDSMLLHQVKAVRKLGCNLPVIAYYFDGEKWDDDIHRELSGLGVSFAVGKKYHERRFHQACKALAVIDCPFKEVLWLDADNEPLQNPDEFFSYPEYKEIGSYFWTVPGPMNEQVWKQFQVEPMTGDHIEGGAFLVDKSKCWNSLMVMRWLSEQAQYSFRVTITDSECFDLSWQGSGYGTQRNLPEVNDWGLLYKDDEGKNVLKHRCWNKRI